MYTILTTVIRKQLNMFSEKIKNNFAPKMNTTKNIKVIQKQVVNNINKGLYNEGRHSKQ